MPVISSSLNAASVDAFQKAANAKSPVALEQKLAKCERQLGDWEACPSGKSPEGRRIIQNLQDQVRSIEASIANATSPTPRYSTGRLLDVYA